MPGVSACGRLSYVSCAGLSDVDLPVDGLLERPVLDRVLSFGLAEIQCVSGSRTTQTFSDGVEERDAGEGDEARRCAVGARLRSLPVIVRS